MLCASFAGKTRRDVEPAAVRGGDVDVLGWFRDKSLNKEASTWGWTQQMQEHSARVLRPGMFLQSKAAGLVP